MGEEKQTNVFLLPSSPSSHFFPLIFAFMKSGMRVVIQMARIVVVAQVVLGQVGVVMAVVGGGDGGE